VTAVVATLPLALIPALNQMFGWSLNNTLGSTDQLVIAAITLLVITVLNIYGVRLVAIVNNTGVIFEILGMVVFAFILALFHNHQGVGVIFKTGGTNLTGSAFLVGMFMSLFVIYGFDTASTLAEETNNPRREAPKAVLASVIGAFVIGAVFIWATLMAIPNFGEAISNFWGPAQIIDANFSNAFATVYLLVVAAAIFVCCMAIMTSTIRLAFGMARDDQLPFSKTLAKVNPRLHTPVATCIIVGLLAAVPFIQFVGAAVIAVGATASIYLSYLLGNLAFMRARMKGWPRTEAPFKLGSWGMVVNVIAILWGLAMMINFLTPSSAIDAWDPGSASASNYLRIFSNPKPVQSDYYTQGQQLLDFKIDFLNKIPVIWTVFIAIFVVGALYYWLAQRKKPWQPVIPPGEDVSMVGVGG
jgi:amino acid transporter